MIGNDRSPVSANYPAYLERSFKVRLYECDAYGHVNHANYLRYMQEAATEASAAAGYDVNRYRQMGRLWLIRDTDITYLRPLVYGDTVIVKTWVGDFRRVRSRRLYDMRLAGSDGPVATASTEWVFLDQATLRPATVPAEMVAAFRHAQMTPGMRREPFPEVPPAPPGTVRVRRRVEWRDIDPAQHVNNANYLAYIEECNVAATAAFGWPVSRITERNIGIVARRYRIEYLEPAVLDDELEVTSFLSDVKRATAVRHNEIRRVRDGSLLARSYSLWVFVDLQTGQPRRIPIDFLESYRPNIAG